MRRTTIQEFADEVAAERGYQSRRWADCTDSGLDRIDDEKNTATDLVAFMTYHATRWLPGDFAPYHKGTYLSFRTQMIKVAALAYAAVRWADKKMDGAPNAPTDAG